ncbi:NAD-dependent epimerase/dehydratase family protein [Nostoc sp.]|uniref:NAD-dependent epimerase/dehydratase family protein n=1 Tax=Nostoc sp. TaxID=1180 RepID=UPI002FFA0FC7
MHFIVTGGAGFIGSHLTEQLLSEGHHVTVVDNLTTGRLENLPKHPRLTFLQKDILICQPEDFIDKVDGIAHLAAISSVTESLYRPLEAHHNNLSATLAVIQLCQALTIPKLVFASSASVYGNLTQLPISEEQKTSPLSPYGLQKLVSEQYASMFAKQLGFSFVGLRIFNVFGPRQVPNSSYSGVISRFFDVMQRGLPITIYGDGNQTRDFIYVKDVVRAFSQALKANVPPGSSLISNLGTGKSTSLVQLINILKNHFPQWQPEINFASPRAGDIQHSQADISRISSCLDFQPQWSAESAIAFLIASAMSKNENYLEQQLIHINKIKNAV